MATEGNKSAEFDRINRLKSILSRDQKMCVTFDEARDIGESLVAFYMILDDRG